MSKNHDSVNNPKHYTGNTSLECIECMRLLFGRKAVYYFCLCNAFKYMWRYEHKNGEEDLRKTKWYLGYVQHDVEKGFIIPKKITRLCLKLDNLYRDLWDKQQN